MKNFMFAIIRYKTIVSFLFLIFALSFAGFAEERFEKSNGAIRDKLTGLLWQAKDDGKKRTWKEAVRYCENLNLAGKSNWRSPHVQELFSITDPSRHDPASFPIFNARSSSYWSATTGAGNGDVAWYVNFKYGHDYWNFKTDSYYVRCISRP